MVRIIDASTRLIDIDFGKVDAAISRNAGSATPVSTTFTGNGVDQTLNTQSARLAGSFVQYERVDLSMMLRNTEVMQPVECVVQRTSPVPLGFSNNGGIVDPIEEYIYVFSRPLSNEYIKGMNSFNYSQFRSLGLDGCPPNNLQGTSFEGDSGGPSHEQTIYAEKRIYHADTSRMLTAPNLLTGVDYNTVESLPVLTSVTTWGSMSAITGPNLHVYRIVINYSDTLLDSPDVINRAIAGDASRQFPPVNITFLCKDPKYSEGEYLTRIANAMGKNPVGGEVAE